MASPLPLRSIQRWRKPGKRSCCPGFLLNKDMATLRMPFACQSRALISCVSYAADSPFLPVCGKHTPSATRVSRANLPDSAPPTVARFSWLHQQIRPALRRGTAELMN